MMYVYMTVKVYMIVW